MNSLLASNINGNVNNQQVANGSYTSVLSSHIDFSVTGFMENISSQQGKAIIKLTGKEELLYNGQNKDKNCDQNENPIENYVTVNGNKEKPSEDTIPTPKIRLFTGKINVEWNQVYKIGAGLNNLGNTCFMNTVMQCLTYCPPLANYLLHDNDHSPKCTITGFCMMCLLQRHMRRTIGKTGEVVKPIDVYQRLKLIAKHFQFGRQEDAHEFLRYVIDHLWKACLPQTNGVTKLDSASKETTVINKIFGGYHRSQVICLRCKKESNTFDHFMDFILDIKQNVMSLEKALEKFTQAELLQQDNCYKCPKCKIKVEAQKRFSVYRAPTVATFQLKRFDYNRSFGGKITKQITYPEKLNLRPYMSDTQGDPVWYHLNAVLVHSGASCNSGHYYCYVKNSNGYWYIMDDQRVHQVSLSTVLNQSAYVLFYIRMENTERAPLKKCLDNKNAFVKGTISNSHFSKVSEMNNLKPMPLSVKNSFSNSKLSALKHSPNGIKKLNFSTTNREKISFGFRTNTNSTPISPPKNRTVSSEPISATRGGLVPYVEDSEESSDEGESNSSQNRQNSISDNDVKHHSKNGSLDSYKLSPQLENKAKLSKSVFGSPSHSYVNSSSEKVVATGSWIVTDVPQTQTSSSTTGVTPTKDWHTIEVSDHKLKDSPKTKENKDYIKKESPSSPKISLTPISKHSSNASETLTNDPSSNTKKSNGYESTSSEQKCTFRKQIFKSKVYFPKDEDSNGSIKRKHCDSSSKISEGSPLIERVESRHSPAPKKAKHAENSLSLNSGSDVRNSGSNVRNSDSGFRVQQRQYSTSNCDTNSRTCLVNGVFSSPEDSSRISSNKNLNGASETDKKSPKKDGVSSKGKQDNFRSESTKSFQFEKEKLPISNHGKNTSLYGAEVPTWREENHYRSSTTTGHEIRRSFDDYDNEFDRGKVRKSKPKDHYQYFHRKNSFQKYADNRYNGKYSGKFYNGHHNNHRKYNNSHYSWKSNRSDGYQRYRNHHKHY